MRNRLLILILFFFSLSINSSLLANNIVIQAQNITLDKSNKITIFENDVSMVTNDGIKITSEFAKYNKTIGFIELKRNIKATDKKGNIVETNSATYDENKKFFISNGYTKATTTENYIIEGDEIIFDNTERLIKSNKKTVITDMENNKFYLDNFEYLINENIFKSVGMIEIKDKFKNNYKFSQIYIDTKKKAIAGTDVKAFLNNDNFKISPKNKPRIFSNSLNLKNNETTFIKNKFTLCDFRENDKCPPWTIQSSKMLHDKAKKTIFYDNAVVKIYDIPVLYLPKLSHPDPSVKRRSGFLIPSFSDTKNLGSGLSIPYFWAINKDKDMTLTSNIYVNENPLLLGEYRQIFEKSNLNLDFGYTKGYKKTSSTKRKGDKSHFFSEFVKNFNSKNDTQNTLIVKNQNVSNNKYLKLYKIKSNLADYEQETLENSLSFTRENNNYFFGFDANIFETLNENYNDKYEYVYPEIIFDKNLFSNDYIGALDLQSNLEVKTYDTNKTSKILVNDFDWLIKNDNFNNGFRTKLLGKIKNVNYEAKNIAGLKEDTSSELFGAIGYLAELNLFKKNKNLSESFLTPKVLLRYAPGSMKKENGGSQLTTEKLFNMNRVDDNNNFENGLSASVGLEYEISKKEKKFALSLGQIINEKENKNMGSKTSLDEKLSDLVGSANVDLSENFSLNYNFLVDQNMKETNYNQISSIINFDFLKINFDYLKEKKHIGDNEYIKTNLSYNKNNSILSLSSKRSLITNSSEFYDLSYEYFNDCLRAGIVYRREFYNDSEIEAENSLMFKVTLVPFGDINSPSINK